MDGLSGEARAGGRKLIADPTDEVSGPIRAGLRIAGLGHCFRPGKRTIDLDGLGQADAQEGGAIGPGFFGFLAEDLADVFHLCPGGFTSTELRVDFAPGRQFNGALVEDAAGPDDASVRADDVGVWEFFIEVPGLAGVPPKFVPEASHVVRNDSGHQVSTHLLHPRGVGRRFKRPPITVGAENRSEPEGVAVEMRFTELVGAMEDRDRQWPAARDVDPLFVIEVRTTTRYSGGHLFQG